VRIRAQKANGFSYTVAPAGQIRDMLNDADVDALDDAGLPFAAGNVSVGLQFSAYMAPGQNVRAAVVSLQSRQPADHVKGALYDLTPWPALETRDPATNAHTLWAMNRTTAIGYSVSWPLSANWRWVGTDDFDGNLRSEHVVRNLATAELTIGGDALTGAPPPPLNWTLAATGDWNADGKADLLWRNNTSQKLAVWLMNGAARVGAVAPTPDQAAHANWEVAGAADFDGDGFRDLLWYNQTSGNLVIWYLDGNLVRITGAFTNPPSVGNNNWKAVAAVDLGKGSGASFPAVWNSPDIVWQNDTSRKIVVWHMDPQGRRTSGTFTTPDALGASGEVVVGPR
jgi:hypothetical protein